MLERAEVRTVNRSCTSGRKDDSLVTVPFGRIRAGRVVQAASKVTAHAQDPRTAASSASRSPLRKRRRGSMAFLVIMPARRCRRRIVVHRLFRVEPSRPLTRGAIAGEHWHASLTIYICGKQMSELTRTSRARSTRTRDGFMHIHPSHAGSSPATRPASATFLRTLRDRRSTQDEKGKTSADLPGRHVVHRRRPLPERQEALRHRASTNKGKEIDGDPGAVHPARRRRVVIAFGPEGKKTIPNPYAKAKGSRTQVRSARHRHPTRHRRSSNRCRCRDVGTARRLGRARTDRRVAAYAAFSISLAVASVACGAVAPRTVQQLLLSGLDVATPRPSTL